MQLLPRAQIRSYPHLSYKTASSDLFWIYLHLIHCQNSSSPGVSQEKRHHINTTSLNRTIICVGPTWSHVLLKIFLQFSKVSLPLQPNHVMCYLKLCPESGDIMQQKAWAPKPALIHFFLVVTQKLQQIRAPIQKINVKHCFAGRDLLENNSARMKNTAWGPISQLQSRKWFLPMGMVKPDSVAGKK